MEADHTIFCAWRKQRGDRRLSVEGRMPPLGRVGSLPLRSLFIVHHLSERVTFLHDKFAN